MDKAERRSPIAVRQWTDRRIRRVQVNGRVRRVTAVGLLSLLFLFLPSQVAGSKSPAPSGSILTVDASTRIRAFDRRIKGIGLANWTFSRGYLVPLVPEWQDAL